jgi:hypothetical protein
MWWESERALREFCLARYQDSTKYPCNSCEVGIYKGRWLGSRASSVFIQSDYREIEFFWG